MYRFRLQEGAEDLARQAVAFLLDLSAQLFKYEDVIGRHLIGWIPLEQGLEGAPGQIASPPRVGNQVQEMAHREKSSPPDRRCCPGLVRTQDHRRSRPLGPLPSINGCASGESDQNGQAHGSVSQPTQSVRLEAGEGCFAPFEPRDARPLAESRAGARPPSPVPARSDG